MRNKLGVLLLLGLLFLPSQPAMAAAKCTQNPQVKVELNQLQANIAAKTSAYQATLQQRTGQLKAAFNNLEDKDSKIRGHWQGDADRRFLQDFMEDQAQQLAAPILDQMRQDGDKFESDIQNLIDQPLKSVIPICTRQTVSRSLRISVPTQSYTGSSTWRDNWGKTMAQYRVQVTIGVRVTGGQSYISISKQVENYRVKLNVQPSVKIRSSIQSKRNDRSSVQLQRDLASSEDRVQINLQGRIDL